MEDEYANMPDEIKMEVLWNLPYDDIMVMCTVSKEMQKKCQSTFFWYKKFIIDIGKNPPNATIDDLKKYVKYSNDIDNVEKNAKNMISGLIDEYYIGQIKYANKDLIINDVYKLVYDIIKTDIIEYVELDENEKLTLNIINDELEYIIESLEDTYQDKIEDIKYIFHGFDDSKLELEYNSMELFEYLDVPKNKIMNFVIDIMKKRFIINQ
jgi:hypothetical protein